MSTGINWADETINPIVGCREISPGCTNCYAEAMAKRLANNPSVPQYTTEIAKWDGTVKWDGKQIEKVYNWKIRPRKIFVGSMTDIFGESVSWNWLYKIMLGIQYNPIHTFILLTKRVERAEQFFAEYPDFCKLPNLWLGVSAEKQEYAYRRIPVLVRIPVQTRWVSFEPLLGEINLAEDSNINNIDWAVIGGESGNSKKIRPCHVNWIEQLVMDCQDLGIATWVKQLGSKPIGIKVPSGKGGYSYSQWTDLPEHLRIREYPVDILTVLKER